MPSNKGTTKTSGESKGLTVNVKSTKTGSVAAHVCNTDIGVHGIGVWNLHVLLANDGDFWTAQGLEIDYVSQGNTIEEAKENFASGLAATININLHLYGNIDRVLVWAPADIRKEAASHKESLKSHSQITVHDIGLASQQTLPFDGIEYLVAAEQAA